MSVLPDVGRSASLNGYRSELGPQGSTVVAALVAGGPPRPTCAPPNPTRWRGWRAFDASARLSC